MSDSTLEKVVHRLGIAWPSAEEGLLRAAAAAFDAAARTVEEQRASCTAAVAAVVSSGNGGGLEQLASFWRRYDGDDGGGVMPATVRACRETAAALRSCADAVEHTKDAIRGAAWVAGATLTVGTVASVLTVGTTAALAASAATALADMAAAAGVALSATVAAIISTAAVGAATGALTSIALDALVVQPLLVSTHQQRGLELAGLGRAARSGLVGGLLGGAMGGALSRGPALSAALEVRLPRVADTLDGLTRLGMRPVGATLTNGLLGGGIVLVEDGEDARGFDVVTGTLGAVAAPRSGRRLLGGSHGDGTWAGEGMRLSRADNVAATRALARAQGHEPRITADVQALLRQLPAGTLTGLRLRLKGPDSYRRKVATTMLKENASVHGALGMRDVIRYTVELPTQDYASTVTVALSRLKAAGHRPVTGGFRPTWHAPGYRGINTSWLHRRSGQVFEVQFHTPESRAARDDTHHLFDEQRLPDTPAHREQQLARQQADVFSRVPVPRGVDDIVSPQW